MAAKEGPRVLLIDIETTPNLAHVWGLWDQNVGLNQLIEATEMLCFAAKWLGQKQTRFYSGEGQIQAAWDLLDEADVVVHFNGRSFDIPHLNREFLLAGLTPPAPYQQVDLLATVRSRFRFPSNKLAYVSDALKLGGKVKHEGHELWVKCMAGNTRAWATMRRYNIQDVNLLEDVYNRLFAWIPNIPTVTLFSEEDKHTCPGCGSEDVQKRGYHYTKVSRFQRYHCNGCGRYSRSGRRDKATLLQGVV